MLRPAAARPAAPGAPAGGETAGQELQATPSWKPDRHGAASGDVAARGDEALAGKESESLVDGKRLDHSVQVEPGSRRAKEESAGDSDRPP